MACGVRATTAHASECVIAQLLLDRGADPNAAGRTTRDLKHRRLMGAEKGGLRRLTKISAGEILQSRTVARRSG